MCVYLCEGMSQMWDKRALGPLELKLEAILNQGTNDCKHALYNTNMRRYAAQHTPYLSSYHFGKTKQNARTKLTQKQASSTRLSLTLLSKCYQGYLLPPYPTSQSNDILKVSASSLHPSFLTFAQMPTLMCHPRKIKMAFALSYFFVQHLSSVSWELAAFLLYNCPVLLLCYSWLLRCHFPISKFLACPYPLLEHLPSLFKCSIFFSFYSFPTWISWLCVYPE